MVRAQATEGSKPALSTAGRAVSGADDSTVERSGQPADALPASAGSAAGNGAQPVELQRHQQAAPCADDHSATADAVQTAPQGAMPTAPAQTGDPAAASAAEARPSDQRPQSEGAPIAETGGVQQEAAAARPFRAVPTAAEQPAATGLGRSLSGLRQQQHRLSSSSMPDPAARESLQGLAPQLRHPQSEAGARSAVLGTSRLRVCLTSSSRVGQCFPMSRRVWQARVHSSCRKEGRRLRCRR